MSMVTTIQPWVQAARPAAHGMIALPLLWGQALALLANGDFQWSWFLVVQFFGLLCQVYILYLNDYADEAVDRLNDSYWLSGGSRVVPDGQLTGQQLYRASFIALLAMLVLALVSALYHRPWMLALTLIAAFGAASYSLKPIQTSYRGYGELHQALSCGVLLPVIGFYMQSGSLAEFPWALLICTFLIFYAGNIITALADTPSDSAGGKRTYPVRHGEKKARKHALILLSIAYTTALLIISNKSLSAGAALFICAPAIAALLYIVQTQLWQQANINNPALCRRFIALTTASQAWIMTTWTVALFLYGATQP